MSVRIKVAIGKFKKDFELRWRTFHDYMPDIQKKAVYLSSIKETSTQSDAEHCNNPVEQ